MTFSVKNKIISLGGSSFVTADNGDKMFRIKGRIFSPTHKKIVCDTAGNKLFVVCATSSGTFSADPRF